MKIRKIYVAVIRYSKKEQFEQGITGGAFVKQIEVEQEEHVVHELKRMKDEEGLYPLLADITTRYIVDYN